jgi:glutamine synthetase
MTQLSMSEQFGSLTFNQDVMREKLPEEVYTKLIACMEQFTPLDRELADPIAHGIKEWALEHGVTHYCHWFQPLTGSTAEKHDSLLDLKDGRAIERFSGDQLVQGEPDASSFPSGGMRSTFEARGYTAWDPSSPVFIVKAKNARILTIPSIFISYHGQALDKKTPLLRSMRVISEAAQEALAMFGKDVDWVRPTLGPEQEYFLIPKDLYDQRMDLKLASRTVIGAASPKDQQLDDHYFAQIRYKVLDFMHDVEEQLRNLGVPVKTRHNEVAPSQFELAVVYQFANVATDHNQLTMQVIREVARDHDFEAVFHEKPFAGINGNGKHCNWSLQDSSGKNLLNPGENPRENLPFLFLVTSVLQGVHRYERLIRSSIATPGNDHRLGANEAPPAIISVFLGEELTKIIEEGIEGNLGSMASPRTLDSGVESIFDLAQDNTDRNRTSPFAFTGDKFEFRAVGGEQSVAIPLTFINVVIGDAIKELTGKVKSFISQGDSPKDALLKVMQESARTSTPIRFEGNNYSEDWVVEAQKRGLSNLRKTPEALKVWTDQVNIDLLSRHDVLSSEELGARYAVELEKYSTKLNIEANTLIKMVESMVLPAAFDYQATVSGSILAVKEVGVGGSAVKSQVALLEKISSSTGRLVKNLEFLKNALTKSSELEEDAYEQAKFISEKVVGAMDSVRTEADLLEQIVDCMTWRMPDYTDLLHSR